MKIQSYNEWDPLKSIIVGTATYANWPSDPSFQKILAGSNWTETLPPIGPVAQYIIDETNEELNILVETLKDNNIKVYRPGTYNFQATDGFYAYCPRDNLLVVGDRVIEVPMALLVRQQEHLVYNDLRQEAIKDGARWFVAPRSSNNIVSSNLAPMFDAANIMRFGNKLLYLISSSGNKLGAEWLQHILTDIYEVITTDVYNATHLDSTICPISENDVVLNASRVNNSNLPEFLKDWNHIYITEDMIIPQNFIGYPYASKWIAINMLALGNKKVICDATQSRIHDELAKHGFEPIPLHLTHARTLGGGFHCVTLDLHRSRV